MVDGSLVSVVIPTYNKSLTIEATVKSVLRQTYRNIEIILVDNGSTDSTRLIISKLEESASNLKVINLSQNFGPSNARNTGIKVAKGRYIFLLDGDDLLHPEKVATQVVFMRLNPEFALSVTSYLISESGGLNLRHIRFRSVDSQLKGWVQMTGFGGLVESTGCIDASRINDLLFFDNSFMGSEGLDFMMKWHRSYPIGLIDVPLTLYMLSENQLHLDTAAIRENMSRINPKYIQSMRGLKRVAKLQSSYFLLNSLRNRSFLPLTGKILATLDLTLYRMVYSIAIRNAIAYLLAIPYRSKVHEYLGRDDPQ
jgi:glycosyltransferase involved in cell wall biosynthesis